MRKSSQKPRKPLLKLLSLAMNATSQLTAERASVPANHGFSEDLSRKARWFHETRGHQSREELDRRRHKALAHVKVLRASRLADHDPGGRPIRTPFHLSGAGRNRTAVVDNPGASASQGFTTVCVHVDLGRPQAKPAALRLRVLRGAGRRVSLSTAKVFRWDERLRRWHMVDHSGYSAASRGVWALVSRSGVYAAIALPRKKAAARRFGLERFAYYYSQLGIESGLTSRPADYFNNRMFRQLLTMDPGLPQSTQAAARHTRALTALHRESKSLEPSWRGQVPNGGLPEWHLIEHFAAIRPTFLKQIGVDDIVREFPWIFRVANRVGRWHPNGPININGRVKSLATHPTDGNILYAGAADGGVWKSIDAASTWRHLWTFQDSMAVGSLAVAPNAPNTIYVATGEDTPGSGNSYGGVGVYKSTNAGASWALKSSAAVLGARCTRIVIHPLNRNIVYLASESGVHKSTDGGETWNRVLNGHATDVVIAHDHPNTLYAGVWNDGLYKTTDGGTSWTRNTSDVTVFVVLALFTIPFPTGAAAGWIKLAIGRDGPHGSNFIIAKLGPDGANSYASFDGGGKWSPAGASEAVEYDEWTSTVAIHPKNAKRLFLGGVNLQYSDDGFFFHPTSGTHSDHHQVVFDPNREATCYCCCDGGVYKSTDFGVNWSLASRYLQATQLVSLGVSQAGDFVAGGATQDQGIIQTDGAMDWQDYNGGNEWGIFVVDPNDSRRIYVTPGPGQLRRSTDGGHTWSNPTQGLTDPWPSQDRDTQPATFFDLAVRPGMSNFMIGAAQTFEEVKDGAGKVTDSYGPIRRLYYSRDWGVSWWNAHELPSKPTRVAYAPSDNTRAYAGTENGRFYRNNHGGQLGWSEPAAAANKPPAGIITGITVDPTDANTVYITYGDINPHVYRSIDGGFHWTSAAGSRADMTLPNIAVSALVVDPESTDILYVGTDIGVFRSNDWGISWYPYNDAPGTDDLPTVMITGLAHHAGTNRLFASTMGRGLYYTHTSGIVSLRVLAVSYNFRGRTHVGIQYLRVTDGSTTYIMTRIEVIRRIEAGTNVYTIGADGSRAEVVVMEPDDRHPIQFLQTVSDNTTADNLMSLPRF